jgi:hypothetical protein
MNKVLFLLSIIAVTAAIYVHTRRREGFEDTKLDRLCDLVFAHNLIVNDSEIEQKCENARLDKEPEYCVTGCDPVSMCRQPAFSLCTMNTIDSGKCDITHNYIGSHMSSFHEDLPSYYLIKEGFCLEFLNGEQFPYVRKRTNLRDVLMRFPESIAVPFVYQGFRRLSDNWSYNTSGELYFTLPFKEPLIHRPDFLINKHNSLEIKTPAMAIYTSSSTTHGESTHRQVSKDYIKNLHIRDILKRRPYSPNKIVITFYTELSQGIQNVKNDGVFKYEVGDNELKILTQTGTNSAIEGIKNLGTTQVGIISSFVIDMTNNTILENRHIFYYGGKYEIKFNRNIGIYCNENSGDDINFDNIYLGTLNPTYCASLLET